MKRQARRAPHPAPADGATSTTGARPLSTDELRWRCDEDALEKALARGERSSLARKKPPRGGVPRSVTGSVVPDKLAGRYSPRIPVDVSEIVGQDRALGSIRTGLGLEGPGFNVFVAGPPGTGRETLVRAALREALSGEGRARWLEAFPRPKDRLYVADFDRPERPRLITLPRGRGKKFKRELDDLLVVVRNALVTAFDDEDYRRRRDRLKRRTDRDARRLFDDFAESIRDEDFFVGPVGDGFAAPELRLELRVGEPDAPQGRRYLTRRMLDRRVRDGSLHRTRALAKKLARMDEVQHALERTAESARAVARKGAIALRRLDERTARQASLGPVRDLAKHYPTRAVRQFVDQLLERLGERVHVFIERHPDDAEPEEDRPNDDNRRRDSGDAFAEFRANLVVDASDRPVPPVVFEEVPTYSNLMGTLEAGDPQGPEHLRIRAGSLLAAHGGVLVLDARELLQDPAAWRALKKALLRGQVDVQRFDPTSHQPAGPVRPRAVKVALKVVVVGDEEAYRVLYEQDDDFRSIFKVKVEVEDDVPNVPETRAVLAGTVRTLALRARLLRPDASALARLLEHAARVSGRRDRLALSVGELIDVLREAEVHARARRVDEIAREDVQAALDARRARHDLAERKTQELIDEGVVLLDTTGARTGQVNALTVYDTGDHVFARPARVTASVALGRAGVIDIEREAHLSGDSHHKGVQIMAGLLRSRWAQDKPLCLTASVCFEQSYSPIDGDSASVAEVVAILSALANAPLDQGWAVTGSLNQLGDVQPIGDVNEKVEGFFEACRRKGLTGRQGVLIPASNLGDLMMRQEVVEAVARGRFHVRAVRTVEDVIEVLAHLSADEVRRRVGEKLEQLALAWRRYERPLTSGG